MSTVVMGKAVELSQKPEDKNGNVDCEVVEMMDVDDDNGKNYDAEMKDETENDVIERRNSLEENQFQKSSVCSDILCKPCKDKPMFGSSKSSLKDELNLGSSMSSLIDKDAEKPKDDVGAETKQELKQPEFIDAEEKVVNENANGLPSKSKSKSPEPVAAVEDIQDVQEQAANDNERILAFASAEILPELVKNAADHFFLFHHNLVATMKIAQALFYPGMTVIVKTGRKQAKVLAVNAPILMLRSEDNLKFEANTWEVEYCQPGDPDEEDVQPLWTKLMPFKAIKIAVAKFGQKDVCTQELHSCIKIGSYVEVINDLDPKFVDTAQIVKNYCGLLVVQYNDETTEIIHMTSPRLRPISWIDFNPTFKKSKKYDFKKGKFLPVLPFIFDLDPFENLGTELVAFNQPFGFHPHKFFNNNLLLVVDPVTRFKVYPGVVSHVYNEYFFRVSIMENIEDKIQDWPNVICHHASPDIAPFLGWPRESGITLPNGITSREELTGDELGEKLGIDLAVANPSKFISLIIDGEKQNPFLDEDDETEALSPKKCLPQTFVEVFDGKIFQIGQILRVVKQFMVITTINCTKYLPPKLYSFCDHRVYPIGFCFKANLKIVMPKVPLIPAVKLSDKYFGVMDLTKEFTCVIGDKSGKSYLPKKYMDGKRYSPKIYINRSCYKGPFVKEDRTWRLQDFYGPGPLDSVLKLLLNDLTTCSETQKIAHLLEVKKSADLPMILFKHYDNDGNERKHSTNRNMFYTMACTTVHQLPMWLNTICRLLDACPGFINIVERPENDDDYCGFGCRYVQKDFPYMLSQNHIHTAHSVYMTNLDKLKVPRKRKTIVEQLKETSGRKPSISPKKPRKSTSEEEMEEELEVYTPRRISRPSITGTPRPTIERPTVVVEEQSDSTVTLSSDNSDDEDDVIPQLIPQPVIRKSDPSVTTQKMPILHRQPQIRPPKLTPVVNNPTTPSQPRNIFNGGPRLRLGNPTNHTTQPTMPIIDPLRIPRPNRPTMHPAAVVEGYKAVFDPVKNTYRFEKDVPTPSLPSMVPVSSLISPRPLMQLTRKSSDKSVPTPARPSSPQITSNPFKWNTTQICAYLAKAKFDNAIVELIKNKKVEGEEFANMTCDEFQKLGFKLGPCLRLQEIAQKLKKSATTDFQTP